MNLEKRTQIFKTLEQANPTPTTELIYHSDFQLLIAVLLSAQATDISVNKATKTLFTIAPTPEAMLKLGESTLKHHIKTIGLYHTKARHIIQTCQCLIEKYNGDIPQTRSELEALPGVGRKTANVVLNTAFNQPTIAVDTHIFRVANRTGLAKGSTPLAVEKKLSKTIPKIYLQNAHHWLILLGRYTCKARKPLCQECPINQWCEYKEKT